VFGSKPAFEIDVSRYLRQDARGKFSRVFFVKPTEHREQTWRTVESRHKEIAANAKGKIFGKLSKEIMVAAKGGADPDLNSRLRLVVEQAKKFPCPKKRWNAPSKKAPGCLTVRASGTLVYEALPRTVYPSSSNACPTTLTAPCPACACCSQRSARAEGSVSWDFSYVGMIEATPNSKMPIRKSPPSKQAHRIGALRRRRNPIHHRRHRSGCRVQSIACTRLHRHLSPTGLPSKNPVTVSTDAEREEVEAFLEAIDADDDVQNVYVGLAGRVN